MILGFFILSGINDNTKVQKRQLQPIEMYLKGSGVEGLSQGSRMSIPSLVGSGCDTVLDANVTSQSSPVRAATDNRGPSRPGSLDDTLNVRPPCDNQCRQTNCCEDGHIPVNMQGVRKGCVYCQLTKSKTRSGYWVYTRYKCGECEVPLCMPTAERDCFQLYHKYLKDGSLQPPALFPDSSSLRQQLDIDRLQRQSFISHMQGYTDSPTQIIKEHLSDSLFQQFPWKPPILHGSHTKTATPEAEEKNDEKSDINVSKADHQ